MYNKQGRNREMKLLRQQQQDHCWQYNPKGQTLRSRRQQKVWEIQTSISASRSAADLGALSTLRAPPLVLIRRARPPPPLNDIDKINTHHTHKGVDLPWGRCLNTVSSNRGGCNSWCQRRRFRRVDDNFYLHGAFYKGRKAVQAKKKERAENH
jgi:hypothetical protein